MEAEILQNARTSDGVGRKCIIVSGMHRSGTSAVARVFNLMGATLPQNIMPATEFNLSGHFESNTLSFLNEDILVDLGLSWSSIGEIDWASLDPERCAGYRQRISDALAEEFPDGSLLVIKDPRISRLLPLWKEVLKDAAIDASFVLPVRHPLEVADSLKRRDGFPLEMGCLLWLRYVLEAELNTRGCPRAFASYANLLSTPAETLAQIASILDDQLPVPIAEAEPAIASFLDPTLRHHVAEIAELKRVDSLYPWIYQAYQAFGKLIADPNDLAARRKLDLVGKQFRNSADAFTPLLRFQRDKLEGSIETLNLQLADLAQRLASEATQNAATTAQLSDRIARSRFLETHLADETARVNSVEAQLADQVALGNSLEAQLGDQVARGNSLEAQLADQVARTGSLEAQIADQIVYINSLEAQLANQTGRATAAEAHLIDQVATTNVVSKTLADQIMQTAAVQEILNARSDRMSSLENRLAQIIASRSWRITAPLRALRQMTVRRTDGGGTIQSK